MNDKEEIFLSSNNANKSVTPKDIVFNILSAVLFFLVALFCNLFLDANFKYTQIFSWNLGLIVIVNWVCGTVISFSARQSGISAAKLLKEYQKAEEDKNKELDSITDLSAAQETLNTLIDKDFTSRRAELERTIAKLIKHKMPEGTSWKLGDKLPKGSRIKIFILNYKLERMTPPIISLAQLAHAEASFRSGSIYDLPEAPDYTGAKWFLRKGGSKILWFGLAPIILSILVGGLTGGVSFASFVTFVGTLAIMIFNAVRSYVTAYVSVSKGGVARFKQIIRIVKMINDSK